MSTSCSSPDILWSSSQATDRLSPTGNVRPRPALQSHLACVFATAAPAKVGAEFAVRTEQAAERHCSI